MFIVRSRVLKFLWPLLCVAALLSARTPPAPIRIAMIEAVIERHACLHTEAGAAESLTQVLGLRHEG